MNYYKYLVKKLGEIVSEEKEMNFILYPFGERAALAKGILNGIYGVQEKAIIDNVLSKKYKGIENLEYLKHVSTLDNYRVLIASDAVRIYEELRENLYAVVGKEYCIELFPIPSRIEPDSEMIEKMEEEGFSKEEPIYHPKKTKSDFYLPLLPKEVIQFKVFMTDDYFERDILDHVFVCYKNGLLREKICGGSVLDIGANIGNHTLYFCNECGAEKVYCFEPVEQNFSTLEKNIRLNHLEQKVVLNQIGLGEKEERRSGNLNNNIYNMGAISLKQDEDGDIQIKRLDDLGIKEDIAFIKIDVEGMERSVLKGGIELIKKNRPYIMVESFENAFPEVRELLCGLGYTYKSLSDVGDWLFCPADPMETK